MFLVQLVRFYNFRYIISDPRSWMVPKYEQFSYYLPHILNDPRAVGYNMKGKSNCLFITV